MENQKLIDKFENSLYEELYHLDEDKIIVFNKAYDKLCIKLKLEIYNIEVFEYLKNNRNKHIPVVYDYWEEDNHLIVIEEYVQGKRLDELLEKDELDDEHKKEIIFDLLDGVNFLHNRIPPIIHRDIKMANIIITDEGSAKLIDYDAAKTYKEDENKDTVLIGTHGSAAPEQYGFGQSDNRTDIYAIGILLKEMFPNDEKMIRIAKKATSLNKEERFQNINELKEALLSKDGSTKKLITKKNVIIFIIYIFIILLSSQTVFSRNGVDYTGRELIVNRICFACAFISFIEMYANTINIFAFLPFYNDNNNVTKYIFRSIYAITFFVLFAYLSSALA